MTLYIPFAQLSSTSVYIYFGIASNCWRLNASFVIFNYRLLNGMCGSARTDDDEPGRLQMCDENIFIEHNTIWSMTETESNTKRKCTYFCQFSFCCLITLPSRTLKVHIISRKLTCPHFPSSLRQFYTCVCVFISFFPVCWLCVFIVTMTIFCHCLQTKRLNSLKLERIFNFLRSTNKHDFRLNGM